MTIRLNTTKDYKFWMGCERAYFLKRLTEGTFDTPIDIRYLIPVEDAGNGDGDFEDPVDSGIWWRPGAKRMPIKKDQIVADASLAVNACNWYLPFDLLNGIEPFFECVIEDAAGRRYHVKYLEVQRISSKYQLTCTQEPP